MPSALEYQVADFTRTIDSDGTDIVIDGATVRALLGQIEAEPSTDFERNVTTRQKVFYLVGGLEEKTAGQLVTYQRDRWSVVSHSSDQVSVCLWLEKVGG